MCKGDGREMSRVLKPGLGGSGTQDTSKAKWELADEEGGHSTQKEP